MKWPNDRKFVDAQGKILDHWRGPMGILEPLLGLTPAQFTALRAVIDAFQNATEEDPFSLSAAIGALSVDDEPDTAADYLVSYAGNTAHRVLISSIASGAELISTTTASGASLDIPVPTGYKDVELHVYGLSVSSNGFISIGFSEDGGVTLLDQAVDIFRNGAGQNGLVAAAVATWTVGIASTTSAIYGRTIIRDYQSGTVKLVQEDNFNFIAGSSVAGWSGGRLLTNSTGEIDTVRFAAAAGTLDAGTIELWGVP